MPQQPVEIKPINNQPLFFQKPIVAPPVSNQKGAPTK
jgi:hypothetical protein